MRVRYVALVPIVFEEDVVGDEKFITQWGNEHLSVYHQGVASMHPRKNGAPYEPVLVEAVRIEDEEFGIDLGDLIAPGLIA